MPVNFGQKSSHFCLKNESIPYYFKKCFNRIVNQKHKSLNNKLYNTFKYIDNYLPIIFEEAQNNSQELSDLYEKKKEKKEKHKNDPLKNVLAFNWS